MKFVLSVLLLCVLLWAGKQLVSYWKKVDSGQVDPLAIPAGFTPANLPGLSPELESKLQAAMQQGPKVFRRWLDYYRPYINDPRLAWIELDYVLMVSRDDPEEAHRVFHEVRQRTPASSPVFKRIKLLEKTYQ